MIRALLPLFVLAMVSSCAALRSDGESDRTAAIAPGLTVTLPCPVGLQRPVRASQIVTLRHGDQAITFQGNIEAGPTGFTLVGLDMLGRRALTVHWTDNALTAEKASWLPEDFDPRNMLADIVVIYWPEGVVRRMLRDAGGALEAGPRYRAVTIGGREVVRVAYNPSESSSWSGEAHYVNTAWGYQVDIRSVEAAP